MSAALRWNCGVRNRTGVRSGCCRRHLPAELMQGVNADRKSGITARERPASEKYACFATTEKTCVGRNESILLTFGSLTLKVSRWVRP